MSESYPSKTVERGLKGAGRREGEMAGISDHVTDIGRRRLQKPPRGDLFLGTAEVGDCLAEENLWKWW